MTSSFITLVWAPLLFIYVFFFTYCLQKGHVTGPKKCSDSWHTAVTVPIGPSLLFLFRLVVIGAGQKCIEKRDRFGWFCSNGVILFKVDRFYSILTQSMFAPIWGLLWFFLTSHNRLGKLIFQRQRRDSDKTVHLITFFCNCVFFTILNNLNLFATLCSNDFFSFSFQVCSKILLCILWGSTIMCFVPNTTVKLVKTRELLAMQFLIIICHLFPNHEEITFW